MKAPSESERYKLATELVAKLQHSGFSAFLVGGCVRDMLLGREPEDYDIATSAEPAQVEAIFENTIQVGRQFGVLIVRTGSSEFQVATFRAESDYRDGRHPSQVIFADAIADAMRRDFTINGLFYDPVGGKLYDWVGGCADLEARIVRTIGDPKERFAEDHLRLLRAVRFAAELEFTVEERTFEAIKLLAPRINQISAERIRDELIKIFKPPHAARGLVLLESSGLLHQILPEVAACIKCDQPPLHHPEGTVFEHIRRMLSLVPPNSPDLFPWAVLLHDVGKPVVLSK
ncbi:MAG: CCA tRNA nucleotidyltransferase, partial [Verrucomicrobiae bacterium]|nr:CCA tRNA nucleotidyltransferase [Verrucomicrobiae bacterium]